MVFRAERGDSEVTPQARAFRNVVNFGGRSSVAEATADSTAEGLDSLHVAFLGTHAAFCSGIHDETYLFLAIQYWRRARNMRHPCCKASSGISINRESPGLVTDT